MNDIDYNELVKAIERLRLIKNTKEEWYAYLDAAGFNIDKRGFKQRDALAIFNMVSKWVDEEFNLSLIDLLNDYKLFSSDNYTNSIKRSSIINTNSIKEVYKEIIIEGYESSLKKIDKVRSKINEYNIHLLFLLNLGTIPAYEANAKDVAFNTGIKSMYFSIKDFIAELYPQFTEDRQSHDNVPFHIEMEKHPFIKEELHKIETRIRNKEATRIDLIAFLINISDNLYVNYHKEALHEVNMAIDKIKLPQIDEDYIWIDAGSEYKQCNLYWQFIAVGMDYFLYKFDRKSNCYTEYTIIFYEEKEKIRFYATHPEAIRYICKGESLEHQFFAFGDVDLYLNEKEIPQRITFHSYEDKEKDKKKFIQGSFPPNTLKRIPYSIDKNWFDRWKRSLDTFKNEFPEYEYDNSNKERLISSNYIYVEKDRTPIDKDSKTYRITSWYEIPRLTPDLPLEQINIDSLILTYQMLERDYITFVEINISIDVTDEESRNKYGITITSNPTILVVEDE